MSDYNDHGFQIDGPDPTMHPDPTHSASYNTRFFLLIQAAIDAGTWTQTELDYLGLLENMFIEGAPSE